MMEKLLIILGPKRYHCRLNKQYYDAKFAQDQYVQP